MSLQTLPDAILSGILEHIPTWMENFGENFKERLYLLAVFQRLRTLALPKIYRHIYIISSECFTTQKCAKKPILQSVDTNAKIIALANCTHMVKSATIFVYGSSTTCAEFQYPIKALRACAKLWPNITKLDIHMDYSNYYYNLGDAGPTPSPRLCKKYSRELAHIMPGITGLLLVNDYFNSAISELYTKVTDVYANQLIKLSNEYEIDHAGGQKFEVIQYLYIKAYSNEVLPRINNNTLVELNIGDIPANALWASFMDSKDDTVVEFPCLKKLRLRFSCAPTNANNPELRLNFPELRSLIIVFRTEDGSFFKMAMFPDEMELVLINAPLALLAQIKSMGMPTTKSTSIAG